MASPESDKKRCHFMMRLNKWPYIKRCEKSGTHTVLEGTGLQNRTQTAYCEEHWLARQKMSRES